MTVTDEITFVTARKVIGRPHISWAEGTRFAVPSELAQQWRREGWLDGGMHLTIEQNGPLIPSEWAEWLRIRNAFTDKKPISSCLPFSYQRIPPAARRLFAGLVARAKRPFSYRWASFPGWPLDLSVDFLHDLSSVEAENTAALTPTPVLLTHDIDSEEGFQNLTDHFLDIEESFGARSTNFIVPCAWPINFSLLEDVIRRGHHIGIHGYDHSNVTPFAAEKDRTWRLAAARHLIKRFNVMGYRSPSLLRTRPLLRDLSSRYGFDSSIPTSGGMFPTPNNGCASARPFEIDGIMALPLTLPRDGSLRFMGYSSKYILRLWMHLAHGISRARGIVVLLTHCENGFSGNPAMRSVYGRFLKHISESDRFEWATSEMLYRCFIDGRQRG